MKLNMLKCFNSNASGWQRNYDAVSATLPSVRAVNAVGAVGFSQGGAVAALLDGAGSLERTKSPEVTNGFANLLIW